MKYIYNKNIKETEVSKPFLRVMAKIDQIHETICICNNIDDDQLRSALEGKQSKLIQELTRAYEVLFNIKASNSVKALFNEIDNGGMFLEMMNQQNITSIEEQIIGME